MYNEMRKSISDLRLGDRIGKGGFVFIQRNRERDRIDRDNGRNQLYIDAACPFCGNVKTYRHSYLKDGKITSCGCMLGKHGHYKHIPQRIDDGYGNIVYEAGYEMNFGWVYDGEAGMDTYGNRTVSVHSKWVKDDKAILPIKELDPIQNAHGIMMFSRWANSFIDANQIDVRTLLIETQNLGNEIIASRTRKYNNSKIISVNGDGYSVSVKAVGDDEQWIKSVLLNNPNIAKHVKNTVYMANSGLFGQTTNTIGDCVAKYADFKTSVQRQGRTLEVYEEFDGVNHPQKIMSERDQAVVVGCLEHNKGLLKLATTLRAFKERDEYAILKLRNFALKHIKQNIMSNMELGENKYSTVIRISPFYDIEEAVLINGTVQWNPIEKISSIVPKYHYRNRLK